MHTTIQSAWEEYGNMAIPESSTESVVNFARNTFYAGAISTISMILNIAGNDFSETAKAEMFKGLHEEGNLYIDTVISAQRSKG